MEPPLMGDLGALAVGDDPRKFAHVLIPPR
jgi:hypothetical protein